mmetsp:Transcript_604/g.1276  ORF Transcript_604/g.1276 Transcript_604/m.1276 type:complete len:1040 (-) Transcript_604:127-3246(-)
MQWNATQGCWRSGAAQWSGLPLIAPLDGAATYAEFLERQLQASLTQKAIDAQRIGQTRTECSKTLVQNVGSLGTCDMYFRGGNAAAACACKKSFLEIQGLTEFNKLGLCVPPNETASTTFAACPPGLQSVQDCLKLGCSEALYTQFIARLDVDGQPVQYISQTFDLDVASVDDAAIIQETLRKAMVATVVKTVQPAVEFVKGAAAIGDNAVSFTQFGVAKAPAKQQTAGSATVYKVQVALEVLVAQPNASKAEQGSLVNVVANGVLSALEGLVSNSTGAARTFIDGLTTGDAAGLTKGRRLGAAITVQTMKAGTPQAIQAQEVPCGQGEVTCNRICAQVCNGNVECLDGRDEEVERHPDSAVCQQRVKFYQDRDSCASSLMHQCKPVADYRPPSWLGTDAWKKDCIMKDETCDSHVDCQDGSDEGTEICGAALVQEDPTLRRDWYGVVLAQRKSIQCLQIRQPDQHCAATQAGVLTHVETPAGLVGGLNQLEIFACQKSDLITLGSGLRKNLFGPNSHCKKMNNVKLRRKPSNSTCADGAGTTFAFADTTPVKHSFVCDTAVGAKKIPRSTAQSVKQRHEERMASDPGSTSEDDLLQDLEYACYCDQQLAWQGMSIMAPPYETEVELLCQPYFERKIRDTVFMLVGAIGVAVVNQVLKLVLGFLVGLEKHPSWTDYNASLLQKLFWAQFANTALIVLFVNANLHGAVSKIPIFGEITFLADRVGNGNHEDMGASWYIAVGAATGFTILMNVFSTALPPLVMMFVKRKKLAIFAKLGWMPATQGMLNKQYEDPDFGLAQRTSQIMNVVVTVIAYCGGFPLLLLFGAFYLTASYWLDKYVFLCGSRCPPMYSTSVAKMAVSLVPVGVFIHVCLSLWAFGNQDVFPSAAVGGFVAAGQAALADQGLKYQYPERYWFYLLRRILDFFRLATIWQFGIFAVGLFGALCYIVSYVVGGGDHRVTIGYVNRHWHTVLVKLGWHTVSPKLELVEIEYVDAIVEMQKAHIIWDYEMENNPRYRAAASTISQNSSIGALGTQVTGGVMS